MSKKQLYICVKDKITGGASSIKTVGLYNNQFDNEDEETPFKYPAVFCEFQPIVWEQKGKLIQQAEVTLTLHIGIEKYTEDLTSFDIIEEVHKTVENFSSGFFTPLHRIEERVDHNHDNIRIHQVDYLTRLTDVSAVQETIPTTGITPTLITTGTTSVDGVTFNAGLHINSGTTSGIRTDLPL